MFLPQIYSYERPFPFFCNSSSNKWCLGWCYHYYVLATILLQDKRHPWKMYRLCVRAHNKPHYYCTIRWKCNSIIFYSYLFAFTYGRIILIVRVAQSHTQIICYLILFFFSSFSHSIPEKKRKAKKGIYFFRCAFYYYSLWLLYNNSLHCNTSNIL